MFGPLPRLHQVSLVIVSLVVFLGVGLWVGHLTVVPLAPPVAATLGGLAGIAVAWALVHDFHRRAAQPARGSRHR